jgi:transglutaminase-like putative cysteine protease
MGNAKNLIEIIKKANAPGYPEDSVALRLSTAICLLISIAAVYTEHEIGIITATADSLLIVIGMIYSYKTRSRPKAIAKILIAVAALIIFIVFASNIYAAAHLGNLPSILSPVASLFLWVQVIHAFDVPARRDLAFSLAGSASLIMVASAQAIDISFGLYLILWLLFMIWALVEMWQSMTEQKGSRKNHFRHALVALVCSAILGTVLISLVPAPTPVQSIKLPASLNLRLVLADPGSLHDSGPQNTGLAQPGSPRGKIGIGGYLGFSKELNTSLRGPLSNQIIMRVRTTIPSYFFGESFSTWNGQSWTEAQTPIHTINGPSPYVVAGYDSSPNFNGPIAIQTYYLAVSQPDLLFEEENPIEIYFPDIRLFAAPGQSIRSGVGMEQGTVYTVISRINRLEPNNLISASTNRDPTYGLSKNDIKTYLQLPRAYNRVRQLAYRLTRGINTTYGKITALETYLSLHTRYSLNIPPLSPGQDAVNTFLFDTKTGFCEQISTALVVMLRTLGIPAREAVGYVPGSYNPLTDLYEVRGTDAHAWTQVWFGPTGGWQDFDPTALVPYANPSPGSVIASYLIAKAKEIPLVPTSIVLCVLVVIVAVYLLRRRPRLSYAQKTEKRLERILKSRGISREPSDTLGSYLNNAKNKLKASPELDINLEEIKNYLEKAAYSNPRGESDPRFTKSKLKKIKSLI